MTKESNTASIEQATGWKWDEWTKFLDGRNAKDMPHAAIAHMVRDELTGKIENPGWWAQAVTVAYEQHIGRRAPGQRADGKFETSVTKTLGFGREEAYQKVLQAVEKKTDFDGRTISGVRDSLTPVRSYWRCNLDNGSKVTIAVEQRSSDFGKAIVSVTHTNLISAEESSAAKYFWRQFLAHL